MGAHEKVKEDKKMATEVKKEKQGGLTQLANGASAISHTDRAMTFLRVVGTDLEIGQRLPLVRAIAAGCSEKPQLKGKTIFASARGVPVRFQFTAPLDWPVEEDRGKTYEIVLTATVGPSYLSNIQLAAQETSKK